MKPEIDRIVRNFCEKYEVQNNPTNVFPRINQGWVVDGRETTYRGMRRLVIPFVRDEMGIEPWAVKRVLWRIAVNVTRTVKEH
jgi:hypothetical protein